MSLDLLAIVAHPDDAELLCGGLLAKSAREQKRVGILDLSAGELGSAGTRETRAQEAAEASRILGLCERRCTGLPDGSLTESEETRTVVIEMIRELRPRVVVTQWPNARHPDHAAASAIAHSACFLAGLKNHPAGGNAYRPHKLIYALTYQETDVKPSFVVDITEHMETKLQAIFAYGSQFGGKTAMGDVLGGDRPLQEQILAHHAHYGSFIRRPYGEPYWTREVVLVDDVVGMGVASF